MNARITGLRNRADVLEGVIRERTNVAVDVGFRGAHHVIVIGRYKGSDFIQSYDLNADSFTGLVDHLRKASKLDVIRRVDAPPVFKAAFKREGDHFTF